MTTGQNDGDPLPPWHARGQGWPANDQQAPAGQETGGQEAAGQETSAYETGGQQPWFPPGPQQDASRQAPSAPGQQEPATQWQVQAEPGQQWRAQASQDPYAPQAPLGQAPDQQTQSQQAQGQGMPGAQWQPGYPAAAGPRYSQVAPRSPAVGLVLSLIVPGLGSMVNGRPGRGIVILVSFFVSLILIVLLIGLPLALGVWIWGMVDGYKAAQAWNRDHGIIS